MSRKIESPVRASESHIAVFQEQAIRRTWHRNEWWFSVVDVVGVLSGSNIARRMIVADQSVENLRHGSIRRLESGPLSCLPLLGSYSPR